MKFLLFPLFFILLGCQPSLQNSNHKLDLERLEPLRKEACPIYEKKEVLNQYKCLTSGANNHNPFDQYNLATFYLSSSEPSAKNKAHYWLQKAAEQGLPLAQHDLAVMYLEGDGVKKDNKLAMKWAKIAVNNGMVAANEIIAGIESENGNYKEAFKLFQIAANTGFPSAQHNLGVAYQNGEGVKPNLTEAVKWYEAAANQGWQPSISILIQIYGAGSPDVPKDETKKQYWQSKLSGQ